MLRIYRGFTLIELLVVIAVMGVLATIVLVAVNPQAQIAKVRDTERKTDLRSIANALERYYVFNGQYPSTSNVWWSFCNGWSGNHPTSGANGWVPNLAPTYLKELPLDPLRGTSVASMTHTPSGYVGNGAFCYIYRSDGTNYKLAAHCAVESETVDSTHPLYKGHMGWSCPSHAYAIYTPGAQGW